jgi:uncharacterized membrane protein YhaH (DUF805 family)
MTAILSERETKVTQALYTMGMMRSAYWWSWITWEAVMALVLSLIAIAFGSAIQIDFFLNNSFGLIFLTLFMFQLAMVGFAFLMAAFIKRSSSAITLGFTLFLVGFIFQVR